MKQINIYTMTSISAVTPTSGRGVYVIEWLSPKGKATLTDMVELTKCNARGATLTTAVKALERLKEPCEVTLNVSEQYIATAFDKDWVNDWLKNGWMAKSGKEIQYKELWQQLMYLMSQHQAATTYNVEHEYYSWMKNELKRR